MIIAQRHIHHAAHHDLVTHHDGSLFDLVQTQDARLRRVQDRHRQHRAIDAAIRDGEGAAGHFLDGQLAVARPAAEIGDLRFDICETHLVGVAQDRHHQTLRCANGHADIVIILVDDLVAMDFRVDRGHFLQGADRRLGEEGHEAQLDAVFLLEGIAIFGPQRHQRRHVDLVEGGQHRRGVLRLLQALGDALAQARHAHPLLAAAVLGPGRQFFGADEDRCRRPRRSGRARRLCRRRGFPRRGRFHESDHIALGQPAFRAGRRDRRRVELVILHQLAHGRRQGRHFRRTGRPVGGPGRGFGRFRRFRGGFGCGTWFFGGLFGGRYALVDTAQLRTDLDLGAAVGQHFR